MITSSFLAVIVAAIIFFFLETDPEKVGIHVEELSTKEKIVDSIIEDKALTKSIMNNSIDANLILKN